MKKLLLLPTLLIALGGFLPAQTLKIFHRSHGGSMSTFTTGDFDVFGISPEMIQQQEQANRKKEEEEKKRLEREAKKLEAEKRKEERKEKKQEHDKEGQQREDAPITDPPSDGQRHQEMPLSEATPLPSIEETAPTQSRSIPQKQFSSPQSESMAVESATEVTSEPTAVMAEFTPHEEQRKHRMDWLYGIMALTIVPTLVIASGAMRRREEQA